MKYALCSFFIVGLMVLIISAMRRWIQWPFSLRALSWCGVFSYFALLALPRVIIWTGVDTMIQIAFWFVIVTLFAWILSYHNV